ncbi:hypothetical protein GH733_018350 [Mirounga leonina]|nr:hypothetical protein GH733_018350 [Mirounga leonina]
MSVAGLKKQFHKATQYRPYIINITLQIEDILYQSYFIKFSNYFAVRKCTSRVTPSGFDCLVRNKSIIGGSIFDQNQMSGYSEFPDIGDSQKVSEKVGGAEGTKLDDDFKEMERPGLHCITLPTVKVFALSAPASRAKLSMINTMSKIRGQEKGPGYPQAEALLAEAMLKFGRELGDDCNFGPALGEVGEAMRELSEVKDSLDMEVKQNFIDPLQNLHDKDLREIQHHLKKLEGRRLDFDYKKKRQGKIPDEELRQALEKFDESKEIAESSMFNLLEMDIEQVSQLSALVQAQLEYHKQAVQILQQVTVRLEERIRQASSQPRREYQPKPRMSLEFTTGDSTQPNGGLSHTGTPKPAGAPMDQPCCRALYDFEPENEGELGFKEGDIITLTNQIDENWYEGMLHGQSGFFPINYVEILVALPH